MGQNPVLKIILLGDSGVGKSSLINRFVKNEFHEVKSKFSARTKRFIAKYTNNRSRPIDKSNKPK